MKMENYFLPHMGLATTFPRPFPFLTVLVANSSSPLVVHVDASSIHHSLFEDYVCLASVLSWLLLWLSIEAIIPPCPLFFSVEFYT